MAKRPPEPNPFIASLRISALWKLDEEFLDGPQEGVESTHTRIEIRKMDVDDHVSLFTTDVIQLFFSQMSAT